MVPSLHVAQDLSQDAQMLVWPFPYVPEGHVAIQEFDDRYPEVQLRQAFDDVPLQVAQDLSQMMH